jgi:hypothetical protein
MKLIAAKQGKTDKYDLLRCVRDDGTTASAPMPRQGILAHDLVHYVVESALRYRHGFLGLIAAGANIESLMVDVHDPSNRELAEQATHAEAIVESLQAQLWNGAFDPGQFAEGINGACAARGRGAPDLSGIDVEKVLYGGVLELNTRWQQVPYFGTLELDMPHLQPPHDHPTPPSRCRPLGTCSAGRRSTPR